MPTWGAHPPPPANPPMGRDRGNSMNGFQSLSHHNDLPAANRQPTPTHRDHSPNVGRDMYGQLGSIHPSNQSPTAPPEQIHRQGLNNPQAPSRLPPPPPNLPPAPVATHSSLQNNLQGGQGVELEQQNPDGTINKNLVTTSIDASQLTSVVHALLRTMQSQSQCIETLEREFRMHVDQSRSQFEGLPKGVEQGRIEALENTVTALNGELHSLNEAVRTNPLAESVDSTRTLLIQLQSEVQTSQQQQQQQQQQFEQLRGGCNQRMEALETGMGSLTVACDEVQKIPHMRQLLQEEITRKMKDAERRFGDQIQSLGSEIAKAEAFTRESSRNIEHAVNKKLSTVYERLQEKLKGRSCEAEQALVLRLDELHKVVGEAEVRAEAGVTRRFEELQNGFRVRMQETEGALAERLEDAQRALKERMESTEGHLRANLEDSTRAIEAVKAKADRIEGQVEGSSEQFASLKGQLSTQSANQNTMSEQVGGLADRIEALERAMVSDLATLQQSQEEGKAKARSELIQSEEKIQQALPGVMRGMLDEALVVYSTQDFVQESLQNFASEVTRRFESAESMVQDFEQIQQLTNKEFLSMVDGRMSPITQRVVQLEERMHGTESSFREREQRLKDNLVESMGETDQRFSDLAEQTEQGLQQVALNAQSELEPLVHDVRSLHAQLTECIPRTEVDCLLRDMQTSLTTALTSALQSPPSLATHQPHIVAAQLASVVAPPRAPAPGPFIRQTPSRSGSPAPISRHESAPTQPPAPQFAPPTAPAPPQPPSPPQQPAFPSVQPTRGESPMTQNQGPSHAPSPQYANPHQQLPATASTSPAAPFAGTSSTSPTSTASSASPVSQTPTIPPTPAQGYDPKDESLAVREARLRQMGAMFSRR